jgi:hypothetical protein
VVPAVNFQPQVVVMAKLYLPDAVNGLWPPPPRPVWSVNRAEERPCSVEDRINVPTFLLRF